jgi:hypothetical protein
MRVYEESDSGNLNLRSENGAGSTTLGVGASGTGFLLLTDSEGGDIVDMGRLGGGFTGYLSHGRQGQQAGRIWGVHQGGGFVHVFGSGGGTPLLSISGLRVEEASRFTALMRSRLLYWNRVTLVEGGWRLAMPTVAKPQSSVGHRPLEVKSAPPLQNKVRGVWELAYR